MLPKPKRDVAVVIFNQKIEEPAISESHCLKEITLSDSVIKLSSVSASPYFAYKTAGCVLDFVPKISDCSL